MLRLIALLVGAFALAAGLDWLAARPGTITVDWLGYRAEPTVFQTVVGLALTLGFAIFAWNLMRQIWLSPAVIGNLFNRRRNKRGLEALSTGLIALGAGDKQLAMRYAVQARRSLPNEPLTHLLRAQAARLAGDKATARRIFEAMLSSPDTEQLGLRGLFLEAETEGEGEAARQFAERALRVNPKLGWAAESLFDLQCKQKDWDGALETLTVARKHGHLDKANADRRRAVLLTGQAQAIEDADPESALNLALEAHGLASDLVPAAAIAGRLLASKGNTPRATKIIQTAWKKSQHPDLAVAYAYARIGDSPRDRLTRVKQLAMQAPMSIESPIALATAAIEAKDWGEARAALEPLTEGRLTQRICTLMARIEGAEHGDKGRVREWLARAVNAPRDPAWTADGVVSDTWAPVSPVTGALDAFQWRVPVESAEKRDAGLLAAKLEELVALGAPREGLIGDDLANGDPKVIEVRSVGGDEGASRDTVKTAAPKPGPASAPPGPEHSPKPGRTEKDPQPADRVTSATAPSTAQSVGRSSARPKATESEVIVVNKTTARPTAGEPMESPVAAAARAAATSAADPAAGADNKISEGKPGLVKEAGAKMAETKSGDLKPSPVPPAAPAGKREPEVAPQPTGPQGHALKDVQGGSQGNSPTARKGSAPQIYVPPRAPDDPGTEKDDDRRSPLAQYRSTS